MRTTSPIRTARQKRGLTQVGLAVEAGLSPATVYRIEAGKVRPADDTAAAIARALDVPLENLFPIHTPEADTASTGCGPTRDTDQPASRAVSPVHTGV